jgi:hypothetical protein
MLFGEVFFKIKIYYLKEFCAFVDKAGTPEDGMERKAL